MKIVDDNIWWKFECKVCGVTCLADRDDVTSRPSLSENGRLSYVLVVICGKCGTRNDVPNNLIDDKISEMAHQHL